MVKSIVPLSYLMHAFKPNQTRSETVMMIAGIYISISTGTFDIENIKYEKKLATVRFRYIL